MESPPVNSPPSSHTPVGSFPFLLINRNFTLLWGGQVISMIGDVVFDMTLALWIVTQLARGQAWAPLAISGTLFAALLPVILVGPLAGVFVDRWERRRTMLWMDALRFLLIVLLLATSFLPFLLSWRLGTIYGVVLLASVCSQFFNPARFALIGTFVAEPDRARASGLTQIPESVASLVGPLLGTLLFFAVGVQWALLVNALSFATSFLALLAMDPPQVEPLPEPKQERSLLREFSEGIRFTMSNRILRTLLIASLLLVWNEGAMNTLNIFFVTQNLHTATSFYAWLGVGFGAGFIGSAVLADRIIKQVGAARVMWLAQVTEGIVILVYARMTIFLPALLMMALFGILVGIVNSTSMLLGLQHTPQKLLGRVRSVGTPMMTVALMLSSTLAGSLTSTILRHFHATLLGLVFTPVDTIFTATGLLAIVSGLYVMVMWRRGIC